MFTLYVVTKKQETFMLDGEGCNHFFEFLGETLLVLGSYA